MDALGNKIMIGDPNFNEEEERRYFMEEQETDSDPHELGDEVETQETEEEEEEKESSNVEESVENNDSTQNMSILLFGALALVLMLIRKK